MMESSQSFSTPILFLIFNRPDTTQRVWEVIRSIKPKYLYIAADGPRPSRTEDLQNTQLTRAIVQPDWDCQCVTLFRDENLGCRNAVSGAISWFFEQVEEGIILEDDCLPDPSFFTYCSVLLEKYRNEPKVMHIGGCNFQDGIKRGEGSYYFSKYNHIWGWATWRRAWQMYDVDMKDYPTVKRKEEWKGYFFNGYERQKWTYKLDSVYTKIFDTWDYQWTFAIWKNKGMAVVPQVNLISNIGFDGAATHTTAPSALANQHTIPLKGHLFESKSLQIYTVADKFTFYKMQCNTFVFKLKFFLYEFLAWFEL